MGEGEGSQTEEGAISTKPVEVEVEVGGEEAAARREPAVAGMMEMTSALTSGPAGQASRNKRGILWIDCMRYVQLSLLHAHFYFYFFLVCRSSHGGVRIANTGRGRGRVGKRGWGRGWGAGMGVPKSLQREHPRMRRTDESSRPRPDLLQMPLQKIHMTSENQVLVKELLRGLQTQDFEDPDE